MKQLKFESFNKERVFLEKLFVGRFSNFLVIFSLIVTAGFANSFDNYRYIVFYFGAALSLFCWISVLRAYQKYDNAVRILLIYDFDEKNDILILQEILKRRKYFNNTFTVSRWLGLYIPLLCIIFLTFVGVLVQLNVIR